MNDFLALAQFAAIVVLAISAGAALGLASPFAASGGLASIRTEDLQEWLGYLASDELQGRATYSMEFAHYAQVPANVAEEIQGRARTRVTTA